MKTLFEGTTKLHPAYIENQSLSRRGRIIALAVLLGFLLSALVSIAIWAIFIQKTATVADLQLLLPLIILAIPIGFWQLHRYFHARPRLRITDQHIDILPRGLFPLTPAKRVEAIGVQSAHILRNADGAYLVLVRKNASPVEMHLLWDSAAIILDFLDRHQIILHDGARQVEAKTLKDAWISPANWKTASNTQRLSFAWNFHLPFLYGHWLARQHTVTASDLERFYRLLRTWADFLFLQDAAGSVGKCLPEFVLPLEDRFRIACVLRVQSEIENAMRALEKANNHEEILPKQLENWRAQFKYRNLPPPPYSSITTRLLSGISHYAHVHEDGTLETREQKTSLEQFVAVRFPQRAFHTAPLELHDILGRTCRMNQNETNLLRDIRRIAPHILYIHVQSYISINTRLQLKKIIKKFRDTSKFSMTN